MQLLWRHNLQFSAGFTKCQLCVWGLAEPLLQGRCRDARQAPKGSPRLASSSETWPTFPDGHGGWFRLWIEPLLTVVQFDFPKHPFTVLEGKWTYTLSFGKFPCRCSGLAG